ncbi:MAG: 50S ribosomal protein L17 [Syntrophobacteraceae bacterium]|nr:50S ribosomal protein L17 [Syntrophobacteraceae bacterium]
MRHGVSGRKLNRTTSHRSAMFRNMVTSLLQHERICTTVQKAKELRRWADWMITLGKRGDLHARRQALATIRTKNVVHKLFTQLAPRYQNRPGGYTRIVKAGYRRGDAAPMCIVELMTDVKDDRKKAKPKTKKVLSETKPAPASLPTDGES